MDEQEANICFPKGKWQSLIQFPDLRQLSRPEPVYWRGGCIDIKTVARLQSLYSSESSNPFPKGPIAIYPGNKQCTEENN